MPTIQTIGSAKIQMYFADHNPPHFHIVTPDSECKVRINDLTVIAGRRAPDMKAAMNWTEDNQALLMDTWNAYSKD